MINNNIQIAVGNVLRMIGSEKCLERAKNLARESSSISKLHLRDLGLNSSNVIVIANCFKEEIESEHHFIKSVSFSYNHLLGDLGAIALAKNLPKSICEVGLVNCGIGDIGGIELLNWMRSSSNLRMICIEQNGLSEKLRSAFRKFSVDNPQVLVVF